MNIFDLGAKISLDSSDYNKGIDEAEQKTSSFGSKIGSALGTVGKVAGAALTAATGAVTAFAGSSVSAGMSFDSAMSQVAATMGTTVDSIQELRDFAQEMGSTTAFSATQSAEALNYMALAGYDAETSMAMLPNVLNLASAGGMELARASDMITDASSALGLSLDETSELVDKMAKASSKSNTSVAQLGDAILTVGGTAKNLAGGTTELSAALGILADNGIKGAEGGTALRNIILSLSAPTDKAAATMEQLGLSAYDSNGNLRSLNDIFTDLNGALSTMTQGEQTQVLNELFNKVDLKSANALLANTGERFNELTGYIDDAAGAADDMAKVQLNNLEGDITLFKSALEGAQIAISDQLTPSLRDFVSFGTESVSKLTLAFQEGGLTGAMDALGTILSDGIAMITEKLPTFIEAGMGLLSALGQGIMDNLPQLTEAATQIILMLINYIIEALPQFVEAAIQIIATLAQGIADALPDLIPAVVDMVMQIVQALIDNAPLLLDAALQLVMGLAQGFLNALPVLIEALPGIIIGIVDFFVGAIPQIIEAGITLLTALVEALPQIIEAIVAALPLIIDGIINGLISNLPQMIEAGIKLFVALIEALPTIITTIVGAIPQIITAVGSALAENADTIVKAGFELFVALIKALPQIIVAIVKAVPQIISGIVNAFGDSIGAIIQVGKDLVGGIWEGIVGAADQFMKDVKEFFGGIVNGVKEFLGIHSPSRLFKEQIGKMIGLGVAEGIEESEDKAVKAAEKLAKEVYSKSKDWIDKQTKYNKWSLEEQVEAWEAAQEQFIEGSKQYADAEEQIFDLREKIRERDEKASKEQVDTYVDNIKSGLEKVRDLWDDYKQQYSSERNSILGAFGLFESPKDREYVEGVELIDNMRKQVRDINQFYDGLEQLQSRGLGRELVDEIRKMGPSAINEVQGLLDLSQEQLDEYWDLYKHKADVATYWTDRYTENTKNIVESSIMRMFDGLDITLDDALDAAYDWGEDYIEQMAKGIESGVTRYFTPDALIAGRLSGNSTWSGDMSIIINAAAGQNIEQMADFIQQKILTQFAGRKQVWA